MQSSSAHAAIASSDGMFLMRPHTNDPTCQRSGPICLIDCFKGKGTMLKSLGSLYRRNNSYEDIHVRCAVQMSNVVPSQARPIARCFDTCLRGFIAAVD